MQTKNFLAGERQLLKFEGVRKLEISKIAVFSMFTILHYSECMKWLYNGYASWFFNHCGYLTIVVM